jgi:indole-3-glycerol phosphate synthase/phosphoribosylanthranilate isomerase
MVPGTPRAVTLERAMDICAASGQATKRIGVFRNEKMMQVAHAAEALALHAVQLHGEEDAGYIKGLRSLLPHSCEIWAAAAVGDQVAGPRMGADRMLFDTSVGGQSGGTGKAFDWTRVSGRRELSGALLAGGLNPGNARAASRVGAFALDVGSGVEITPGNKDLEKLSAFFAALRLPVRGEIAPC